MKTLGFIAFVLISSLAVAQSDTAFIYTYGGGGDDEGKDILQTSDGGYIILGSTSSFGNGSSDLYVLKLDSNFQVEWTNAYGGPQIEVGEAILPSDDGGYHLIGYTNSFGSGGYDVFVVKIDSLGNEDWQDTYGGANWDFAYDATRDSLGNIYIVGETYSFQGGVAQGYLIKIDEFGTLMKERDLGGVKRDILNAIFASSDSIFYLTGENESHRDSMGTDVWVAEINHSLDVIWENVYGGNQDDGGHSIHSIPGELLIAGYSVSESLENDKNIFTFSTDLNGALRWSRKSGSSTTLKNYDDEGLFINTISRNRILQTGYTKTYGGGQANATITTFRSNGTEIGSNSGTFGYVNEDIAYKGLEIDTSVVIILGKTRSFSKRYADVLLLKLDTLTTNNFDLLINYVDTSNNIEPTSFKETLPERFIDPFDKTKWFNLYDLSGKEIKSKISKIELKAYFEQTQNAGSLFILEEIGEDSRKRRLANTYTW